MTDLHARLTALVAEMRRCGERDGWADRLDELLREPAAAPPELPFDYGYTERLHRARDAASPAADHPEHGTVARWVGGCRCASCRAARIAAHYDDGFRRASTEPHAE